MNIFYVLLVQYCLVLLAHVAGIQGGSCDHIDKITLQVHDPYSRAQFTGYIAAQKLLYFDDQCLDVTILFRDADTVVGAVLSNSAQFGTNFVPAILDDDNGTNVIIISQLFQRSGFRIVWPTSSNIAGCDLRGKLIGRADALGLPLQAQLLACEPNANLDSFVFIQNPPVSSPMKWDVDAMSALSYKEYAQLLTSVSSSNMKLVSSSDFVTYEQPSASLLEDAVFVSRTWLANSSNQDIAKRFLIASFKGWIYCRDNEQACAAYGSGDTDALRLYEMREVNKLIWPSPLGIGTMNQTSFMHTAQIMHGLNFARNYTFPLPYTNDITNEALLSLVSIDTGGISYNATSLSFCSSGSSYVICANSSPTGPSKPVSLTVIIAIVIPVSIVIAILAAIGLFLLWRRKALVKSFSDDPSHGTGYQINIKELKIEAKIGSGSFGDVYKGTWRDTPVAIKRLRSNVLGEQLAELNREAAIMLQLRHPHIVLFMGCCSTLPDVCIVTEFMPKGSLFDILHDESCESILVTYCNMSGPSLGTQTINGERHSERNSVFARFRSPNFAQRFEKLQFTS